ncbi:4977_t:CDS:1, partial [Gigaspora margarita]
MLILIVLIKTSTTHVIPKNHTIIKHIEKNSTNDNQFENTSIAVINSGYPIHKVLMVARGWLFPIEHLRLHWVDWTQKSKWYEEIYVQGGAWVPKNLTSPSWAAGYYFEIKTDYGNSPQLFTTLWWDGW